MIQTVIRFESSQCSSGYEPVYVGEGLLSLLDETSESGFTIPNNWLTELRARGPEIVRTLPLGHDSGLFMRFATLPYDPEAYQTFTDDFGRLVPPLSSNELPTKVQIPALGSGTLPVLAVAAFHSIIRSALGMPADVEPTWVGAFRRAYSFVPDTNRDSDEPVKGFDDQFFFLAGEPVFPDPMQHLRALIEAGTTATIETDPKSKRPSLVLRLANLMVAIALQTVKHLSGDDEAAGVKLLQCKQCGNYFNVGPGTGRRSRAMFCSRRCQNQPTYQVKKSRKERQR